MVLSVRAGLFVAILATALLTASASHAVTITFSFEGVATGASGGWSAEGIVGDTVTGTFTYDTATPDSNGGATVGDYDLVTPPGGMTVTFGSLTLDSANNPTFIDVVKVSNLGTLDQFNYKTDVADANWDSDIYGNFNLLLKDCTVGVGCLGDPPIALGSDALPISFDLSDWDHAVGSVQLPVDNGVHTGGTLSFTITSIVPEPSTGALLGLGLMGIAAARRRR